MAEYSVARGSQDIAAEHEVWGELRLKTGKQILRPESCNPGNKKHSEESPGKVIVTVKVRDTHLYMVPGSLKKLSQE